MIIKSLPEMICLIISLLTMALPAVACPVDNGFVECKEEWCFQVAQPPSAWPPNTAKDTVSLEQLTGYSLRIPAGFEKIYRVSNLLIFSYGNKTASISFEEISRNTIPELPKDRCMTMGDLGHAIFTRTPKDPPPCCKSLWLWALKSKSVYFRKNVPIACAKKNHLTVYYSTSIDKFDPAKTGGLAVVINDKRPDAFVVMRTAGIDALGFKNLIGSIDEVQRGAMK